MWNSKIYLTTPLTLEVHHSHSNMLTSFSCILENEKKVTYDVNIRLLAYLDNLGYD